MTNRSHYRRRLILTGCLATLAGSLLIAVFIVFTAARLAATMPTPRQVPPDRSPQAVGITDYEEVSFTTLDEIVLSGWYVPSHNGAAIILVHRYGGNRQDMLPEAGFLVRKGYGVLLFDLRGHGRSGAARVTFGDHEQRDLAAALDFVMTQPAIDPARIGGVGFSMGGAALALAAASDSRWRAVVIEAAFATLDAVIDDQSGLLGPLTQLPARWSIQHQGVNVDRVRPVDALCAISPRPLLLIYGDQDRTIPPGTAQAMFSAACQPVQTWLVPGAGHQNYTQVSPDIYPALVLDFFEHALR